MDLSLWQTLCYLIIGAAFTAFIMLDGFDLGIGIMLPFFSKEDSDKRTILNTIWPFWDGNELWGLIAGGGLFAAFPSIFASILSSGYLVVMVLFLVLIYRPLAFELWFHSEKHRGLWERMFLACSALLAFLAGYGLTILATGLHLTSNGGFALTWIDLLHPLALINGFLLIAAFLSHGASFVIMKTEGETKYHAGKFLKIGTVSWGILSAVSAAVLFFTISGSSGNIFYWLLSIVMVGIPILLIFVNKFTAGHRFFLSNLGLLGFLGIQGLLHFPIMVNNLTDPAASLSIYTSSSSLFSLQFLSILALIGVSVAVGYNIFVYRVFKGKIDNKPLY